MTPLSLNPDQKKAMVMSDGKGMIKILKNNPLGKQLLGSPLSDPIGPSPPYSKVVTSSQGKMITTWKQEIPPGNEASPPGGRWMSARQVGQATSRNHIRFSLKSI